MTVKRKLDGIVDESSADWEIWKSDATEHELWKIWMPVPSRTQSYDRLASRKNLGKAWYFKSLLQIEIFDFPLCLPKVLHYFNNFDALLMFFSGKYCYKFVL